MTRMFSAVLLASLCAGLAMAQDNRVVVMTSYPQELIARYETAFEVAHPEIDLVIEWRRSGDAWQLMQTPEGANVDVYWAPSLDTFVAMADAGYFTELDLPMDGLPGRIGDLTIDDPQRRYAAFEVAGFGFAYSRAYLDREDLNAPQDWTELADPRYAGAVLMPVPSRQGFSPMIYAGILQGFGWEQGWSIITGIAANAELMGSGGGAFIDELAAGSRGIAPTIDFFPKSAAANGAAVDFRYAGTTLFSPAYVAQMKAAPHRAEAEIFISYVLGPEGQALLLHRDIARLPVRPDAYAEGSEYKPFDTRHRVPAFDFTQAGRQLALLSALFDVQITQRHADLVAAFARLRQAELLAANDAQAFYRLAEARKLLSAPPVEQEAAAALAGSMVIPEPGIPADGSLPVQTWAQTLAGRMTEALAIIDEVTAAKR